jgi:hypothetical protein
METSRTNARRAPVAGVGIWKQALAILIAAGNLAVQLPTWADGWQPVGPLSQGRDGATATVLADGTVLVAGGEGPVGDNPFAILRSAERFDPKTNRFETTGTMRSPRLHHAATRLGDGRVLLFGGLNSGLTALATVEAYDSATGTFATHGRMTTARIGLTATLLPDGRVLVVGGTVAVGGRRLASAELYDPATGVSTPTGAMVGPRTGHNAVSLPEGKVAILGGDAGQDFPGVRQVEIYDPASGTFTTHGEIAERRGRQTATLLPDGRILIAGGVNSVSPSASVDTLNTLELYDPGTGQSQTIGPMMTPRYFHEAVALPDGSVLLLGGSLEFNDGPATAAVERVDPVSGKVSVVEPMAVPRARPGAALLPDGRVLVFGGFPAWGVAPTTHAEVYMP